MSRSGHRLIVLCGLATCLGFARPAEASHSDQDWTTTIQKAQSVNCVDITPLDSNSSGSSVTGGEPMFQIRNRCDETFAFEVASCRRTRCGDTAHCDPVTCSGGPYRVQPVPDGGLSDTSTWRGMLTPDGGSDVGEDVVDGTASPSDTSRRDGGDFDAAAVEVGIGNYSLEQAGLEPYGDFSNDEYKVEVTFDWRLGASRSGTFRVEIEYLRETTSTPTPPICACTSAREGGGPIGPWGLFAAGWCALCWRRD